MYRYFLFLAAAFWSSPSAAEEALILNQDSSPLQIASYSASYTSGAGRYSREGILHAVEVTNSGDQAIVAYTVSFVSFDAFNEDMGRALGGVSIARLEMGSSAKGSWRQTPYAAFTFDEYGTGVAYVSKVRLADGTVWRADENYILSELRNIRSDLTADIFESKEE